MPFKMEMLKDFEVNII